MIIIIRETRNKGELNIVEQFNTMDQLYNKEKENQQFFIKHSIIVISCTDKQVPLARKKNH